MQIKDLNKLEITKKTIDEYYVDVGQIICSDEFSKHIKDSDHRERSVKRLIESKRSFCSNANILYTLMQQYVKVECPTCHTPMSVSGGGGSGDFSTTNYRCNSCKTKINLTLPHNGVGIIGEID